MKLTEEQIQIATQKLKENTCPNCGNKEGNVFDPQEYQLMSYLRTGGNIEMRKDTSCIPIIAVTCDKCGYITLFDATILGVSE